MRHKRDWLWALEIVYPKAPGALTPQEILEKIASGEIPKGALFPLLLKYIFSLTISYVGVFLFLYLIYLALKYFFFSFGNPTALKEVKEQIKNVLLAFFFIFFSLMVVSTLNPFAVPPLSEPKITFAGASLSFSRASPNEFVVVPLGKIIEAGTGSASLLEAMAHEIWKVTSWLPSCDNNPEKCPPWDWRYWEKRTSQKNGDPQTSQPFSFTYATSYSDPNDLVAWYANTNTTWSSGERVLISEFQCQDPPGANPKECKKGSFKIQKNNNYELYRFDENYIYLVEDTSWAVGPNQDVMCVKALEGGEKVLAGEAKQVRYDTVLSDEDPGSPKRKACQNTPSTTPGQKFSYRYLKKGESKSFSHPGYVLGFSEAESDTCCLLSEAPGQGDISGPIGVNVETRYLGCVFFESTGILSLETIRIEEKTTGEVWLLNPRKGLIAWYSYKNGFGSYPTQPIDPLPPDGPPPGCQSISSEGFSSSLPSFTERPPSGFSIYKYELTGETPPNTCFQTSLRINGSDPKTGRVDYSLIFKSGSKEPGVRIERLVIGPLTDEEFRLISGGIGTAGERLRFIWEKEYEVLPGLPFSSNRKQYFEIGGLWLPKVFVKPGKEVKLLMKVVTSPTAQDCEGGEFQRITLLYTIILGRTLEGHAKGGLYSLPYNTFSRIPPALLVPSGASLANCLDALYRECSCAKGEGSNIEGECKLEGVECVSRPCEGNPCQRVIDLNKLPEQCFFLKSWDKERLLTLAPETLFQNPQTKQPLPFHEREKKVSLEETIRFLETLLSYKIEELKTLIPPFSQGIAITQRKEVELASAKFLMNNTYPPPIPEPVFKARFEESLAEENKIIVRKLRPWYQYTVFSDPLNFYVPVSGNEHIINLVNSVGILSNSGVFPSPISPQELKEYQCFWPSIQATPLPSEFKEAIEKTQAVLKEHGININKSLLAGVLRLESLGLLVEGGKIKECQNRDSLEDSNCCTKGSSFYGDRPEDLVCFAGQGHYSPDLCSPFYCSSGARLLNGCKDDGAGNIMPLNIKRVFENIARGNRYYNKSLDNLPVSNVISTGSIVMCGGAMGPMQIMSGNWLFRQPEIENIIGRLPSPYNLWHALIYTSLHIRDTAPDALSESPSCLAVRVAGYRYNGDPRYGACLQDLYNQYAVTFGEKQCIGE